ncbi:EAL domain-containing protein [Agrobacterium vitis]|uniref:sensor domain-containing phosphodiesterase n=1 Tax=Rhizobium/Agrobacterium group TaxID=227290 RepID=UPI0008DBEE38|nr:MULTISPECIES: sensor domain-containing phosphodiesterase [Rhizobium/Agrobacterium group]MCF1434300.1 sensor domain-containing phosphodiesterase [Allorhizobium ampelinum]MUO89548.1 EAL domain-containing protein [Agrobacterium vitis]MUZ51690.1 EAL domain-containing protein [Agrobacterium vitis]MUZ90093.1 EAL domain-containing protein [Agrobacterium vitis]MVA39292.1 EAL domain-containing protein [Agrobacterium vitis]
MTVDQERELARLTSLRNLKILDTLPSESFDRITRIVSEFFGLPVAAVSLTDVDRQWFKSKVGIEHNQIPRFKAPCAEVAETCRPLIVNDFHNDAFYVDSPLGQAGVRFYAGVPLMTTDGYSLGALCVLDNEPHTVGDREMAVLSDMAAMVMAQIEMQHAVGRIEAASGLPNRFQLLSDLADIGKHGGGKERLIGVLDLARTMQFDRLSRVMGPSHLDGVIRSVAQFLQRAVGDHTASYHIGAMQFALIPPEDVTSESLLPMLKSLLSDVGEVANLRLTMTPSLGVTWFNPGAMEPENVLRSLQSAVQDARDSETGIAFFSDDHDLLHRRNFRLLQDFPVALASQDQLHLVFQPRLSLKTGQAECAEALLRWTHPELGSISPAEFVPVIEASDLVRAMSAWVIDKALSHLAVLRGQGIDMRLSINISALNLNEPEFLELLKEKLAKYDVLPGQIEFELTETAMMRETEKSLDLLHALSAHGVRLAIDDFGTGYSSLAYMQKLPADVVKIDRSFVADMAKGNRERVLVRSMINLSHSLGYEVVAEGVETLEAADLLQAMGCDEIQGFWLSRPMAAEILPEWLRHRREAADQAARVA